MIAEEAAGIQTLRLVAGSGHAIVAAVAAPPGDAGSGLPNVWDVAHVLGVPTWPAQMVRTAEFAARLQTEAIDLILNVHSLHIIPAEALRAARIGAFNLHPAALPRYAGLNAVSWAIYRGETTHGVTVHWMIPKVDAGPIAYQTQFPIEAADSAFAVAGRCTREGLVLLRSLLQTAASSPAEIPAIPQELSKREYFGRDVPEQGRLTWTRPARRVVDFVRACDFFPSRSAWGHPRAILAGKEVVVGKATMTGLRSLEPPGTVRYESGALRVAATDEWVSIDKLVVDGRLVNPPELRNRQPTAAKWSIA